MSKIRFSQFLRHGALGCFILTATLSAGDALGQGDGPRFSHAKVILPSAGLAFPSGRFGETDVDADPPKSGNDRGFSTGIDVGYFVNEFLALGVGFSYAKFPLDFGEALEEQFPTETAYTSVVLGQAWVSAFLPNGFERWRPYALVGVGIGRPRGTIDYEQAFVIALPDDQGTVEVKRLKSAVNTAVAMTGGLGVLVPLSRAISLMIEPRYTTVSTKGSGRTDEFTDPEGEVTRVEDTAKSNTNWWEIRGGVVLTIR